jgi:hypothetical protein
VLLLLLLLLLQAVRVGLPHAGHLLPHSGIILHIIRNHPDNSEK